MFFLLSQEFSRDSEIRDIPIATEIANSSSLSYPIGLSDR